MHVLIEPGAVMPTHALNRPPHAPTLYDDAVERDRHAQSIERLAEEIDFPVQLIRPLYEETLARLKCHATIPDYLPILVAKGVRQMLKEIGRHH